MRTITRALVLALVVASGCSSAVATDQAANEHPANEGTAHEALAGPDQTADPSGSTQPTRPPRPADEVRTELAPLTIDDRNPPTGYRRDEWPTWLDIDGDGCRARDQALIAASDPAPQVGPGCDVGAGRWRSAYDGVETDDPRALDVDHVVPLANAYASGGDRWSTDQRARFANDQANLWVVSASANRSKGDRAPDRWRPPRHDSWCEYARRWISIKVRWQLVATTSERDALGQLLETC